MIELVGYLGSVLVVVSLLMTRILRLRVIGMIGSATFLVYGILIGSVPIVITNTVIVIINSTFLWRANRVTEWFSLLEVRPDSGYLEEFLRFHHDAIVVTQPDWNGEVGDQDLTMLVLRDMQPAAAVVGTIAGGVMELRLDFAIPQFRDHRMGKFLYDANSRFFIEKGIVTVTAPARIKGYIGYLEKVGFTESAPGRFERSMLQEESVGRLP